MQAGTEFAMESCSRLRGFVRGVQGRASFLRNPVDQGRHGGSGVRASVHTLVARAALGGRPLVRLGAGPVLLGLGSSVVFFLGKVLSALGLSPRYVVCNCHLSRLSIAAG